jgi:hypothetical protein
MSQFDWPITKKKLKIPKNPKIEDSMERSAVPLAHLYRFEGEDFGQNIWD